LLLNELATVEYNAYTKCFASRRQAKSRAFRFLGRGAFAQKQPSTLEQFVAGLQMQMKLGGPSMSNAITPEYIMELGGMFREAVIKNLTLEERLEGIEDYLEEQRRASMQALLVRNLLRSLELRFQLDEVTLQAYQARFEQCELETLEQITEKFAVATDEATFAQSIDDLAPPTET
jgi:hypothetical protein